MLISLIAALTPDHVIGDGQKLLWNVPEDLKFFKTTTLNHVVVMGRRTFDSCGKPLPKRFNIVITRDAAPPAIPEVHWVHTLDDAIALGQAQNETELFICGGSAIYALALPWADRLYLTWMRLRRPIVGAVKFPAFDPAEWNISSRSTITLTGPEEGTAEFVTYDRPRLK